MQTQQSDIIIIIIVITIILLLLVSFIVSFLFIYQKRIYRHKREVQKLQEEFRQEMLKAQIELQEQVLGSISAEIHDNLGQMLSVIKLNLSKLSKMVGAEAKKEEELIIELKDQVSTVISDMRNISKTLSPEFISDFGLSEAVKLELERIDKTGFLKTNYILEGEAVKFNPRVEIVLFRITQELMNNAIKHAEAKTLEVVLHYSEDKLLMTVADDGKGFDINELATREAGQSGNGLKNMANRVKVVGGTLNFESSEQKGTKVNIEINTQNNLLTNPHQDV